LRAGLYACKLGIRLYSAKLIQLKILKQRFDFVVQTAFFDAAAAVAKQNLPAVSLHFLAEPFNLSFAEKHPCRRAILEIFHKYPSPFCVIFRTAAAGCTFIYFDFISRRFCRRKQTKAFAEKTKANRRFYKGLRRALRLPGGIKPSWTDDKHVIEPKRRRGTNRTMLCAACGVPEGH